MADHTSTADSKKVMNLNVEQLLQELRNWFFPGCSMHFRHNLPNRQSVLCSSGQLLQLGTFDDDTKFRFELAEGVVVEIPVFSSDPQLDGKWMVKKETQRDGIRTYKFTRFSESNLRVEYWVVSRDQGN